MLIKIVKTYTNGAKFTAIIDDRDHDEYVARIDAEVFCCVAGSFEVGV